MRDLTEELKAIRNSQPTDPLKIHELEDIAEKISSPKYEQPHRQSSLEARMLPECYKSFNFSGVNMHALHEETLFYIFYAMAESGMQIKAYNELIKKGYHYSRILEGFVMISGNLNCDNKKRTILLFDQWEWVKVSKEVIFDESFVNSLESYVEDEA